MRNDDGVVVPRAETQTIRIPRTRAMVVIIGGRLSALPYSDVAIDVQTPRGIGRLRWLSADGTYHVHFTGDPLDLVHEFERATCRPVAGGTSLLALEVLLAGDPEPVCDLDEKTLVDEWPAGVA